jgi:CRP-like cAMP-binding protein
MKKASSDSPVNFPNGSWLTRQPAEFRRAISGIAHSRRYKAGETIFNVGDRVDALMGIVEGAVAMSWSSPIGEILLVHLWWPGDWTGGVEFSNEIPSVTGTTARTESEVLFVPHSGLRALLAACPQWWSCVAKITTRNLVTACDTVLDLMVQDPKGRCVAVMLRAVGARVQSSEPPRSSFLPISQEELATMANLHRNTVGKVLQELTDLGLIGHRYRAIELLDVPGLRRLVIQTADARPERRESV